MTVAEAAARPSRQLAANSKWTCVRGQHKGLNASIVSSNANTVTYKFTGGDADNWGRQKFDQSKKVSLGKAAFLANYVPTDSLGTNAAGKSGSAYRRTAAPGRPQLVEVEPVVKAQGITFKVETITPAMAHSWLANGGKNRHLNETRVSALAAAIKRGEWRMTGEGIKLDHQGHVRDGQHRLAAIDKSGMEVQSLVVRGVDEEAFDVIDTGRSRSVSDILGLHDIPSRVGIAACCRNLMFIDTYGTPNPGLADARAIISPSSTLKYLRDHPEVELGYRLGESVRKAGFVGGAGTWGAMFVLFWRADQARAEEFAELLQYGVGLERGHPALLLRNRCTRRDERFGSDDHGREEHIALGIKAWNAWRRGERLTMLVFKNRHRHPEAFPQVIGEVVQLERPA